MSALFEIREYIEAGKSPFAEWFDDLDSVTAARVDRYIRRLETGSFGAAKVVLSDIARGPRQFALDVEVPLLRVRIRGIVD